MNQQPKNPLKGITPAYAGSRLSLPIRGAWVEIQVGLIATVMLKVAPHTGSVG